MGTVSDIVVIVWGRVKERCGGIVGGWGQIGWAAGGIEFPEWENIESAGCK